MTLRKLNILVYTGTGTTVESVRHCIYTLRRLLSPNYAVIPITETVLLKEPWAPSCALLVLPGGADLGYCRMLNGPGNRLITQFVRRGGAYLGFCAGGYYASARCEFEVGNRDLEVVGPRELAFFPGTCRGGAFRGFAYHSEKGARAAKLAVRTDAFGNAGSVPSEFRCYYNGGGVFVDAEKLSPDGVEVLAEYGEELDVKSGETRAAVVYCKVGEGTALLTGPHPEFAAANLTRQPDVEEYDRLIDMLTADENSRSTFMKACLAKLGLEVNPDTSTVPSLSKLHLSALRPGEASELLHSFSDIISKEDGEEFIRAENDVFHIESVDSKWSMSELHESLGAPLPDKAPKDRIVELNSIVKRIVHHEEAWPEPKETPCFNHAVFYSSLEEYRRREDAAESWGDTFMYGEVVTSTNTLLEKNHSLLCKLPTGFTLVATTQIAGRGRGSNVWVSPAGSLIMSTVINHPAHYAASRPIVFIQYLAAVAIVEAIQTYDRGYDVLPVKLKWPNDIYAKEPGKPSGSAASYVKIGGILANCAYAAGNYQIVLGIGINTTNAKPTTSLNALVAALAPGLAPFRIEKLVARILTRLEGLYGHFCRNGFTRELEEQYYQHWLHSNQVVTLEAEGGTKARIVGITRDWGLLKAEELRADGINGALRETGKTWALQSDENSFDFWKGLVRRKL
ncbi:hypothetical protein VTK73DRAFT_8246 [Phialemonium thermophilum]|uniref:BPL/LPL catalytic domain-containing protein n=1 Tax=Phialemonium thermophilum TaxID=223376 RepID=A0ABR3XR71_9PEZI